MWSDGESSQREQASPCTALTPIDASAGDWETELFVVCGADRADLRRRIATLHHFIRDSAEFRLKDIAYTLNTDLPQAGCRLAVVAASRPELCTRLMAAAERLADPRRRQIKDTAGIYYFSRPLFHVGGLAFLFPGEGSQYLNMLADLCPHFPEVAQCLEEAQAVDRVLWSRMSGIFLAPERPTANGTMDAEGSLRQLDNAISAILLADWAMFRLLSQLGLEPAAMAGHSMGELAALLAAGCLDARTMRWGATAAVLNQLVAGEGSGELASGTLLAVATAKDVLEQIIREKTGSEILLAMDNCPHQCVAFGSTNGVRALETELHARAIMCERLPFNRPYHTRLFEPYLAPLHDFFDKVAFHRPRLPVYSCSTGRPFPSEPAEIRDQAVRSWAAPIEFTSLVRNMHADGVCIFVECGPRGNLTSFVEDILRGNAPSLPSPASGGGSGWGPTFAAVASNLPQRSGPTQLNHLAAELAAHHVPIKLDHLYSRRDPQRVPRELVAPRRSDRPATSAESRPPVAAADVAPEASADVADPATGRSDVLARHWQIMQQFLEDQREIMESYFARRNASRDVEKQRSPDAHAASAHPQARSCLVSQLPMLRTAAMELREADGAIVARRRLDSAEDLFASHHTVGGQAVSKIDTNQHGLPVMPMTFTLELMSELALLNAPSMKVVALRDVRLFRWLTFEDAPTTIEISAHLLPGAQEHMCHVQVEIHEIGSAKAANMHGPAAQGIVVLAKEYPQPPPVSQFLLSREHPCRIPVEVWYRNLFHGPLFQGAQPDGRAGDEGIENDIVVLPRHPLLRSHPDPQFLIDPLSLDVAMHPLTGWHLEFPDQSGRILLPIAIEKLELFGPPPEVGVRLTTRGTMLASSYRHFTHAVDVIGPDRSLWCRIQGLKFWRFYVPFSKVSFHGPKDEYFISREWKAAASGSAVRACCMRLDVPPDQKHPGMLRVTAKVTLAPSEWRQFSKLGSAQSSAEWLFDRLAAKDAVRMAWHSRHGERLFPADILIDADADGRTVTRPRDAGAQPFPSVCVAHAEDVFVGVSAFTPQLGIALTCLRPKDAVSEAVAFDEEELALLDAMGRRRDEWAARFRSAKQAVGGALGCGPDEDSKSVAVRDLDDETGMVKVVIRAKLAEKFPQLQFARLIAHTARDGKLAVAVSFCESDRP
jgi:malonyl CoA-acyl carrier protein transacylase